MKMETITDILQALKLEQEFYEDRHNSKELDRDRRIAALGASKAIELFVTAVELFLEANKNK